MLSWCDGGDVQSCTDDVPNQLHFMRQQQASKQ